MNRLDNLRHFKHLNIDLTTLLSPTLLQVVDVHSAVAVDELVNLTATVLCLEAQYTIRIRQQMGTITRCDLKPHATTLWKTKLKIKRIRLKSHR